MVNIYSDLNKSYALDDMVCIKDIRTERDKKRAEDDGFPVGFTRSSWREQFPSIPAKYVFCRKSVGVFGPSSLIYYDKAHYICFDLQIYNGQCLDIVHALNTGKEVPSIEEQIQKQVDKMMKLYEEKEWTRLLMPNYSEASGLRCMELMKEIVLNEPASGSIYAAFINFYTMCDAGASMVTPEILAKLELCKTDEQKETTAEKLKDMPDVIRVYRGCGSESTPYQDACSWTTDEDVAYFFASWRDASNSRVYSGYIRKEDVLEYIDGRNESEVIVRRGTVYDVEEMECFKWKEFEKSIRSESVPFSKVELDVNPIHGVQKDVDDIYSSIGIKDDLPDHSKSHTKRVALMASFLFDVVTKGSSESEDALWKAYNDLMEAAKWHDTGRKNDFIEEGHGLVSARIHRDLAETNTVAEFLMEFHCRDEEQAKEFMEKNFAAEDQPLVWLDYEILRDADALDRWRFGRACEDFVDMKYLHLEESKKMMPIAAKLLKVAKIEGED